MSQASEHAEIYRNAARLNREDPILRGSTLVFPNYGQLVMTGDLHGHTRNFERIKKYCDLEHAPARHVILHEIIHEEPETYGAGDMSHLILLEAARWKCEFPDQVHFLLGNHDLAQMTNQDISKGGRIVTFSFLCGISEVYKEESSFVVEALLDFIASCPLAGRTANRIMLSHSLPRPNDMDRFDPTVLDRELSPLDLREGGSAYALVWGRYQTAEQLDQLRAILDVDLFICGHQPQETGYAVVHDRLMILASDHNHGVFLPFDLKRTYDIHTLENAIRPLASIA